VRKRRNRLAHVRITFRPNRRLHHCPSNGSALVHELTFAFVLNNALGSPALSPPKRSAKAPASSGLEKRRSQTLCYRGTYKAAAAPPRGVEPAHGFAGLAGRAEQSGGFSVGRAGSLGIRVNWTIKVRDECTNKLTRYETATRRHLRCAGKSTLSPHRRVMRLWFASDETTSLETGTRPTCPDWQIPRRRGVGKFAQAEAGHRNRKSRRHKPFGARQVFEHMTQ
jgi:hypothetical protein